MWYVPVMRAPVLVALSLLAACGDGEPTTPDEGAEEFGRVLESVLTHPERALTEAQREVVIATIRHMEDFPLDASLAPLVRPILAWAAESTEVHVVACAAIVPTDRSDDATSVPTRLGITYYMLELVAQSVQHPERAGTSEVTQVAALEAGVRAYVLARDRVGRNAHMEALADVRARGALATWHARSGACR